MWYLFLLGDFLLWLGHNLLLLREDHLDVARGAHVGVDPAVCPVRAPAHLGSLVHLDVLDDQGIHIETLAKNKTCDPLLSSNKPSLQQKCE